VDGGIVEIFPPYNFIAPGSCPTALRQQQLILTVRLCDYSSLTTLTGGLQQPCGYRIPVSVSYSSNRDYIPQRRFSNEISNRFTYHLSATRGPVARLRLASGAYCFPLARVYLTVLILTDPNGLQHILILLEIAFKEFFNRYHRNRNYSRY